MINYDFYDIHAVLVAFRFDHSNKYNFNIANVIKSLLDSPQIDNAIEANIIRRTLVQTKIPDSDLFAWTKTNNIYTYGIKFIKDEIAYRILSEAFAELILCLTNNDISRFQDLSDALHNVPIILADGTKRQIKLIKTEITQYRKTWNPSFLSNIIK